VLLTILVAAIGMNVYYRLVIGRLVSAES
jgi:hypothetical protein